MDEPVGFWVRQIASDGAVIAVMAIPGQQTVQPGPVNMEPPAEEVSAFAEDLPEPEPV